MREIKFRAWDTKEKRWRYHYHEIGGFSIKGELILLGEFGSDLPLERFLNDVEIQQFTGLKDKNGKEVYEGDIVRFLNGETTSSESGMDCEEFESDGVIFWEDESAQWDITHRIDVSREDVFTDISEYEVVGNMYQHHHLLKA